MAANPHDMIPFSTVISSITADGGDFTARITPDWQQGRTTYGGLSAALCVAAALRTGTDLPPLRTAQFTFIGPAGGDVRITSAVLRQGKNSVFIGADVIGEQGLATRATLTFGAARPSVLAHTHVPMPDVATPENCPEFFIDGHRPTFSHHFEAKRAGGRRLPPEMLVWCRHKDEAARTTLPGLIALGDVLPPAAFTIFPKPAPISTITWSVDVLAETHSPDGWHLFQSTADTVADGYSSQDMKLWSADGMPILAARQTVAIFI